MDIRTCFLLQLQSRFHQRISNDLFFFLIVLVTISCIFAHGTIFLVSYIVVQNGKFSQRLDLRTCFFLQLQSRFHDCSWLVLNTKFSTCVHSCRCRSSASSLHVRMSTKFSHEFSTLMYRQHVSTPLVSFGIFSTQSHTYLLFFALSSETEMAQQDSKSF